MATNYAKVIRLAYQAKETMLALVEKEEDMTLEQKRFLDGFCYCLSILENNGKSSSSKNNYRDWFIKRRNNEKETKN